MVQDESMLWLREGTPAVLVRLMRVVGLAPVVFESSRVRISKPLSLFGQLLIFVTVISNIVVLHFVVGYSIQYRNGITSAVVWITECFIISVIHSYGGIFASARMKTWVELLNKIDVVNKKFGNPGNIELNMSRMFLFILCIIMTPVLLITAEAYLNLMFVLKHNLPLTMLFVIFASHVSSSIVEKTIQLHMGVTCYYFVHLLKNFNKSLEQLIRSDHAKHQGYMEIYNVSTDTQNMNRKKIVVSPRSLNRVIDTMGRSSVRHSWEVEYTPGFSQSPQEHDLMKNDPPVKHLTILQLISIYTEICDLVKSLNEGKDGLMMVFIVINCGIRLIVTNHNLLDAVHNEPIGAVLLLKLLWSVFYLVNAYVMTVPGNTVIQEINRIQLVISKLMSEAGNEVTLQLEKLFVTVMLTKPTISPLGMFTLSRSLLISILGFVMTYLVILQQFRSYK